MLAVQNGLASTLPKGRRIGQTCVFDFTRAVGSLEEEKFQSSSSSMSRVMARINRANII